MKKNIPPPPPKRPPKPVVKPLEIVIPSEKEERDYKKEPPLQRKDCTIYFVFS
uniref:Uncharacterized protein n=1 Tax=viral metagenome TaxID=1070528 RepID=A0A6C0KCQ3_9ZZZZ